jgi:small subunit ribosomal protein S16
MGRKHRPFFRICACDSRSPRDGRVIEELGTYDPMIADTDARVTLDNVRVGYWLGVGAQPSVNVRAFLKKYGPQGQRLNEQQSAREKLALPKVVPPAPEPVYIPSPKSAEPEAATAEGSAPEASGDEPQVAAAE